ncbi:MAG: 3'-5' exonuclease, partial [Patescibacteria group bacterium]
MKKSNLAFIDLETTGLDPVKHEIIEIGCILARQVGREGQGPAIEVIEEFDLRVKPEHLETSDPESLRINGYNEMDWLFAVDLGSAMKAVSDKTDGAILVAQNVAFDWLFLEKAFVKTSVPNKMDYHRLD